MEFLLFLNSKDKEILNLIYKANYTFEENTPLCLLGNNYFGFFKIRQRKVVICTENAKRKGGYYITRISKDTGFDRTSIFIRRALRHESIHVAQACNQGNPIKIDTKRKLKIHPYKIEALKASTKISGSQEKEYQAYALEDKPKYVIMALKKYCL